MTQRADTTSLRAALLLAVLALLLGGCASGGLVLHEVGSAGPGQPPVYVNATPEQARQGLRIGRSGQALTVDVGMALATGDVIETADDTIAVIRFPDGHEATLLPGTRVALGSLIADFGQLFVRVFRQVQGQFKVKTQYVTAGVEGTEFWVRLDRDQRLTVGVVEGRISLSSVDGRWPPLPVRDNEVATATRDAAPVKLLQESAQVDSIVRLMRNAMRLTPRLPPPARLPARP